MATIDAFKAPSLVSKKTQKKMKEQGDDDVVIESTSLPTRNTAAAGEEDLEMQEVSDKPNFAPASAAETKVYIYTYRTVYCFRRRIGGYVILI